MKFQVMFWIVLLTAVTSIKFPILSMYMAVGLIPVTAIILVRALGSLPEWLRSLPEVSDVDDSELERVSKPIPPKPFPSKPEEGSFRFYEMYDE